MFLSSRALAGLQENKRSSKTIFYVFLFFSMEGIEPTSPDVITALQLQQVELFSNSTPQASETRAPSSPTLSGVQLILNKRTV